MITFMKKTDAQSPPKKSEENRFEHIRKAAKERHQNSDTKGVGRREDQTADHTKLL